MARKEKRRRLRASKKLATATTGSNPRPDHSPKPLLRRTRPLVVRACLKHGNHDSFIPINHLSLDHFPEGMRSEELLKTVLQVAQLVVRVRLVKSNKKRLRSSAAAAEKVRKSPSHSVTCTGLAVSFDEDQVIVRVPYHTLGEHFEAEEMTVEFFYDSNDSEDSLTIHGLSFERHSDQTAEITCSACPELGKHFRFRGRPPLLVPRQDDVVVYGDVDLRECTEERPVVALISHPHGYPKKVTFGHVRGFDAACDVIGSDVTMAPASPSSSTSSSSSQFSALSTSHSLSLKSNFVRMLLSIMKRICRLLSFFGRQSLTPIDVPGDDVILRHDDAVLRHDAASCPGSSGGAVIVIGSHSQHDESSKVTSLPVFLHMGATKKEELGVAVPL